MLNDIKDIELLNRTPNTVLVYTAKKKREVSSGKAK